MTKEEALQYGRLMLSLEEDKESAMYDFIAKAVKALEQEPVFFPLCQDCNIKMDEIRRAYDKLQKQDPCEDCISREAAICLADELKDDLPDDDRLSDMVMSHNEGVLEYQTKLSLLPSVTPAEKVGHWEYVQYDGNPNIGNWHCSECRAIVNYEQIYNWEKKPHHKFCPNCGARMASPTGAEGSEE